MLSVVMHGAKDLRIEDQPQAELFPGEVRVRIAVGGICGSDLSYYRHGGVADFKIREPLILGHEVAGDVIEITTPALGLSVGMRGAVNPSRPCLTCGFCRRGRENLCIDMRFLGSAARLPHVQGAFSESVAVRADQCIPIPASMSFRIAACAEPLAVALHAVNRAGPLLGRHVVIAGAGPIGLLCLASVLHAGVASATVLDISDEPLVVARQMGADAIIQVARESDGAALAAARHGGFDIAFEASGAPASLAALVTLTRRGGRIVQIGLFPQGDLPLNVNMLMTREIDLVGSFRFDQEFVTALELLAAGKIDISPILTTILPIGRAGEAFELAADRRKSIKVQLAMG